jgi:hypothetical protein
MKAKLLMIAAILLSSVALFGQGGYKGSINAEVTTEDGSPLPGAVAELTADTFSRSFVSDANGTVRFVGLVPSRYELKVTFTGFNTYVRPNIIVDTGQNVRLSVVMTPSTQQEEMVVTVESPMLDASKVGSSTILTEEELNAVPQSRDPWSVIMTVPGVQTDRINVGGSEAGQQSNFASKGDDGSNATWVMDGIEFVDPGARGATQSYLDFSSFQQMSVTTGGADVGVRSGGAALNFVTKQGSNNHQGSIRLLYADEEFQSSHSGIFNNAGVEIPGNRISETFEKSFEIGGPLIKDRLWYWGAFTQNSINQIAINGAEDRTELRNVSVKLHGDITATTRFNVFYTEGDKIKNGRGAGANRPPNTTWDQSGPSPIYKFEVSQLIGQHTELALLFARVDGGFALAPKGDPSTQIGLDLSTGIWDDTTFIDYSTKRPVRQYELKGNTFLSSSTLDHELQYGFQYKDAAVTSATSYGNDGLLRLYVPGQVQQLAVLYREGNAKTELEYTSITMQDTMTMGNWTFKVGLRYDKQEGNNTATTVGANPFNPELLPGVNVAASPSPFSWDTISPRIGATYSWGDENQYLFRASVAQFYETLGSGFITPDNAATVKYSYHYWYDNNQNLIVEQGELSASLASDVESVSGRPLDTIDRNLDPPKVDEFIVGAEWAVTPEFTLGTTITMRERTEEIWTPVNGASASDYTFVAGPEGVTHPETGESYTGDQLGYYILSSDAYNNSITTNRPGYSEDYFGIELTATKRLSNRWMMRGNISFQDWTRNVGNNSIVDPTHFRSGSNEDGAAVGIQSAGSGNRSNIFFGSSNWTANINGLYQMPWDVTVSANINAREGYVAPYAYRHQYTDSSGFSNTNFVLPGQFEDSRFDDLFWADFKLTKTFHLGGRTKVEIAAELFNAFNDDSVLARELRLGIGRSGEPVEIMAPRVGRFSATVHF